MSLAQLDRAMTTDHEVGGSTPSGRASALREPTVSNPCSDTGISFLVDSFQLIVVSC